MASALIAALLLPLANIAAGDGFQLAVELYAEGHWRECRTESRRALIENPKLTQARVLAAASSLKLGEHIDENVAQLSAVIDDETVADGLRTLAAYEVGRAHWAVGEYRQAHARLSFAFLNAECPDLYLRAGCTLFLLMREQSDLKDISESINAQIASNRRLYNWELQQESQLETPDRKSIFAKPGEWTVKFYRSQIGPAIGMRCHCVPSCSEYFRQACRKHGMLGFAIMADRFYREPSVVQEARHPVVVGDEIRYADPLTDHDFWMQRSK